MTLAAAILTAALVLVLELALPEAALAWGPGAHMELSQAVLARLDTLPHALAQALAAHPDAFRYGALAPDIFVGKGCRVSPRHSHVWATPGRLWERLSGHGGAARLRAFHAGYVSHLAADVAAHNVFVPNALPFVLPGGVAGGTAGHVAAEGFADACLDWDPAQAAALLARREQELDALLRAATGSSKVVFSLRKKTFRNTVRIPWRHGFDLPEAVFGRTVIQAPGILRRYATRCLALAEACVMSALADPASPVFACDPVGMDPLLDAQKLKGSQKRALRRRKPGAVAPLPPELKGLV